EADRLLRDADETLDGVPLRAGPARDLRTLIASLARRAV
ncbi:polyprenyl synthetase family protein, partial [Streptomyces sp. SID9913]|nr:polyprenyl synthetase family protein [Streptomyces sp. SID9913]